MRAWASYNERSAIILSELHVIYKGVHTAYIEILKDDRILIASKDNASLFSIDNISKKEYIPCGIFVKKTMRTPKSEIELAQKYKSDYERRHHHE